VEKLSTAYDTYIIRYCKRYHTAYNLTYDIYCIKVYLKIQNIRFSTTALLKKKKRVYVLGESSCFCAILLRLRLFRWITIIFWCLTRECTTRHRVRSLSCRHVAAKEYSIKTLASGPRDLAVVIYLRSCVYYRDTLPSVIFSSWNSNAQTNVISFFRYKRTTFVVLYEKGRQLFKKKNWHADNNDVSYNAVQ